VQRDASRCKDLPASELEQWLLDDLGERWTDVENSGGDLVDCVPDAHRLDERLDEERGLRAEDMAPSTKRVPGAARTSTRLLVSCSAQP
jgi:hypothetical protein